jgi:hypothetical protein
MKNMIYALSCALVILVVACSNDETATPVKSDELGLVMPSGSTTSKVILMENGVTANPISGISNFDEIDLGSKLLLSYSIRNTQNGITNIDVLNFEDASDSTFVINDDDLPEPAQITSTAFSGTFYFSNADSTSNQTGEVSLSFATDNYSYSIDPEDGSTIAGTGDFQIVDETIVFSDASVQSDLNLEGEYNYSLLSDYLYLWKVTDGNFFSYALKKD